MRNNRFRQRERGDRKVVVKNLGQGFKGIDFENDKVGFLRKVHY